jgi:hypothetical protein
MRREELADLRAQPVIAVLMTLAIIARLGRQAIYR